MRFNERTQKLQQLLCLATGRYGGREHGQSRQIAQNIVRQIVPDESVGLLRRGYRSRQAGR